MTLNEFIKLSTQVQIAEMVGVSQAMVSKWVQGDPVASEKVLKLAKVSEYKLTPHAIRPDLYPHPNDGLPSELRTGCSEVV